MAIDPNPDIRCENHNGPDSNLPPAVAVLHDPAADRTTWRPRCGECVADIARQRATYDVAYLDPARQRRPTTVDDVIASLHHHGYAIVHKADP